MVGVAISTCRTGMQVGSLSVVLKVSWLHRRGRVWKEDRSWLLMVWRGCGSVGMFRLSCLPRYGVLWAKDTFLACGSRYLFCQFAVCVRAGHFSESRVWRVLVPSCARERSPVGNSTLLGFRFARSVLLGCSTTIQGPCAPFGTKYT